MIFGVSFNFGTVTAYSDFSTNNNQVFYAQILKNLQHNHKVMFPHFL